MVLSLDLQGGLVDSCELDDRDQIVSLLEDIDGREGPGAAGCTPQPVAFKTGFQRPLKTNQRVEWTVALRSSHASLMGGRAAHRAALVE